MMAEKRHRVFVWLCDAARRGAAKRGDTRRHAETRGEAKREAARRNAEKSGEMRRMLGAAKPIAARRGAACDLKL